MLTSAGVERGPSDSSRHSDTSTAPGGTISRPANTSRANSSLSRHCAGIPATWQPDTADIAEKDGIALLDNGKVYDARAWEVTYEDQIFHVVYECGYLTEGGEII